MKIYGGSMVMKKRIPLGHLLTFFILSMMGCDFFDKQWKDITNSGSSSSKSPSNTASTTSSSVPAHGQATINLLERSLFQGRQLNAATWSELEAYCKAGPTHLIVSDMDLIPGTMSQAGFNARINMQYYALSRNIAGANWDAKGDPEGQEFLNVRSEMEDWWFRYINAIVQIMQKAPQTTAVIIVNDGHDKCGRSLGYGTSRAMGSVSSRVSMGDTVAD